MKRDDGRAASPDERRELLRNLGRAVRQKRTGLGLSLRELSARADVSERFLVQLEAGQGNISVARLHDVARALETRAADLLVDAPVPASGVPSARHVIALLGLRGSGKSTIGARAAETLGVRFVELDSLVERAAGMRLRELFELHGTGYYRGVERAALSDFLTSGERAVLATGGGLVTDGDSYATLRHGAVTVWLRARPEDHWARVVAQGDARPMANRTDAMADLRKLLRERTPLYERADHIIDTSALGLERATRAVVKAARGMLA
jgi:XRE family aerobic/anaerobic benzoate catabolism transcriptional regulator